MSDTTNYTADEINDAKGIAQNVGLSDDILAAQSEASRAAMRANAEKALEILEWHLPSTVGRRRGLCERNISRLRGFLARLETV